MELRLLIVEDDALLAEAAADYFTGKGWSVEEAEDGIQALERLETQSYHLILLDVMIPGVNGFDVCRRIRKDCDVPVIFITARVMEEDMLNGYALGADDYVTKPFNPIEVIARVKSQLRRYTTLGGKSQTPGDDAALQNGGISLNDAAKAVTVDGEPVNLTPIEYNILLLLMKNPGRVFSTSQIYELVWNDPSLGSENTVAVHIRHLREKIEIDPANPQYIKVVWGLGYKMEKI